MPNVTDVEAVRAAAKEFDAIGRDAFLERYGFGRSSRYFLRLDNRDYDSKALIGAAHGYEFPELGPLDGTSFSGGEAALGPLVSRLGLELIDARAASVEGTASASIVAEQILALLKERYESRPTFDQSALNRLVKERFPERVRAIAGSSYTVKGSAGIGTAAEVPWVSIFPAGQSSARSGFYLVYLFSSDGSRLYLSLNQGTDDIRGGTEPLKKRAIDLRRAGASVEAATDIYLGSSAARPKRYEAGSAAAICYYAGEIPDDDALAHDVRVMEDALTAALASGLRFAGDTESLHVVFKWNADVEPRTLIIHEELARVHGSVWWGRFAQSTSPSVSAAKAERLSAQISAGDATHAYLYRRGSVWRADILEATAQPPDQSDPRFPSYYRSRDCNFFVRLANFHELPADWLLRNVVLASQPEEGGARLNGALSNQTTPLFVYELWQSNTVAASLEALPPTTLSDVSQAIAGALRSAGLRFGDRHDDFVRSFVVSLATKRFALLTGMSGSGKTRLALGVGQWFGEDAVAVVPVRPDWSGPEAVLGYENGLYRTPDGRPTWSVTATLAFLVRAFAEPTRPFLLVLDEMNLAHVERYFADLLSGMESGQPVIPAVVREENDWVVSRTGLVPIPPNLFIVGTVNVDETTHMFSPKVLDRANTLEFRVSSRDLRADASPVANVTMGESHHIDHFLIASSSATGDDWPSRSAMAEWLVELHTLLSRHDREFGHRVFVEALRFGALLADAGEADAQIALDLQVLQKVLPRVHGSLRSIGSLLSDVTAWCWYGPGADIPTNFDGLVPPPGSAALPQSFDKAQRMLRRLHANHFVGFAE